MKTILGGITLAVAFLPTIVIMVLVLKNAKYKREPIKKIASVFGISALSTVPAIIFELIGTIVLALLVSILSIDVRVKAGQTLYQLFDFMLVVGPVEEACKYFTFKWIIFHDREFDNTYDGVIYGAASALGFATLENLMYVFLNNDSQFTTAVMRALLSVPMHAITGIVMGYWFGISKYRRYNNVQPETHPEHKAFLFAVLLHGAYDFIVTVPEIYNDSTLVSITFLVILIAVMGFIYLLMGRTIRRAKAETHNIYNRYYYEQLDGAMQDMIGGKTSEKRRFFGFIPFGRPQGFNPYNPYAGMNLAPQNAPQNTAYVYGTQQPYNPYNSAPSAQPQWQYGQQQYGQGYPQAQPMQPQQPVYPGVQPGQPQPVYGQAAQPAYNAQQPIYQQAGAPSQQPELPKVFCGNCGAEQKPGTKYCRMCGSKLADQQ